MTEKELQETIEEMPIGAKLQIVKTNGDILDVVLASHETGAVEQKSYGDVEMPALPPAITVQGGRWGTYRIDADEIVKVARISG
jgi:hypothetical protein